MAWRARKRVDDTPLAITELVQNAFQHTSDGGELALSRPDDVVLIEVFDHSPDDLRQLMGPHPRRIGGHSMLLVEAVSRGTASGTTSTGKVVVGAPTRPAACQPMTCPFVVMR
jgi:hypothetical protein